MFPKLLEPVYHVVIRTQRTHFQSIKLCVFMNYKNDRMSGLLNFRQTVYSVPVKRYQDILSGRFGLCLTEYDTGMLFDVTTCVTFHADCFTC
jgi:hypothetical protein